MPPEDEMVMQLPYGMPIPPSKDRADFVDKIKPEQLVEVVRHKLLGEEMINGKWTVIPMLQDKALSQKGAWDIANLMLACGSINMSISKINIDQINARLRNLIKETMILMIGNWEAYHIKDKAQFYYVKSLVFSNALGVLSQAGEGSIQELFKTTVMENRTVNQEKRAPNKLKSLLFGDK